MADLTQAISELIVSFDGLAVARMRQPGLLSLRLWPESMAVEQLREVLDGALPDTPNGLMGRASFQVGRLGPDEWLFFCEPAELLEIEARLKAALADTCHALVDVSGNRARFRIAGARSLDLLAIGCGLDLSDRAMPANSCVQTVLAKAQVIITKSDDGSGFEVYPRRSFARYLRNWLAVAAVEFRA
jgi:heterotetrameric sarcosine oxidase gamma subunit